MRLEEVELATILPAALLTDEKMRALAAALDNELRLLAKQSRLVLQLPRLDELPHEVLDQLANQYHVDFFSPTSMNEPTKRKLIRESLLDHRIKGTKAAVENLLNRITRGAKVTEWFEYGGDKYFFKVNLQGLLDYGDDGEIFMQMINATKNERSWLDAIDFRLSEDKTTLYIANINLHQGNIFYDLNNRLSDVHKMAATTNRIVTGSVRLTDNRPFSLKANLQGSFISVQTGRFRINCELSKPAEETLEAFERYIREKWREFKQNPVIKYYSHDAPDGELDDDETFPIDVDFLRLYFSFKGSSAIRYLTLLNPKDNLTAREINALSLVSQDFLLSRKKHYSDRIIRALYVKKETTKII